MEPNEDYEIQQKVRSQAFIRQTAYNHPQVLLKHEPITHRECEQLHKRLRGAVNDKIQTVKRNQDIEDLDKLYSQKYAEFAEACIRNEMREKQMCSDICEMHNIADLLLHPPAFGNELFLSNREAPNEEKRQELDEIFLRYEKAYKAGEKVEQSEAEQAIKRAQRFLLRESDI